MQKGKALLQLDKPLKIAVYLGNFTAFESNRYLDAVVLAKARQARIEIGTVEAAGMQGTLVAEIRKGMVVKLSLGGCDGCARTRKKRGSYAEA